MPLPTRIVTATFQGRPAAKVLFVLLNTVSDGTNVEEAGTQTVATLDASGVLSQALLCQDASLNADPVYDWRPVFGTAEWVRGVVIPAGTGSVGLLGLSPVGAPLTPTQFTTLEGLITTEAGTRATADTTNVAAITAETSRAQAAEAANATNVAANTTAITTETTRATTAEAGKVPTTRTVNGHALSADVTVSKADVGLGSVDNTADTAKPVSAAQQAALDLKAPLASPALTGTPTAPTQTAGNNSTRLATTAYTDTAVATQHTADNGTYGSLAVALSGKAARRSKTYRDAQTAWDPSQLSGVVAWFRADSLVAAGVVDGGAVASWADKSTKGNTVTQGTGANQPILKTGANGINNQPVVRFSSASAQVLSKSAASGIPLAATAGFTVLVVFRLTTLNNSAKFVAFTPATTSNGWLFGTSSTTGNIDFVLQGAFVDFSLSRQVTAGTIHQAYAAMNTDFSVDINLDSRNLNDGTANYDKHIAGSRDVTGTPTLLGIGGPAFTGNAANFLDGDLAEVVIVNRALSLDEKQAWARYASIRYGTLAGSRLNATAPLTIPTPDGTGVITEPTVVDFGPNGCPLSGLSGYRYVMSAVGFASSNAANENPSLYVSNNKTTWVQAPGVPFPLVPKPTVGTNADPCLRYFGGKLYLYWTVGGTSGDTNDGVWVSSSTDGVTWSTPAKILGVTAGDTNATSVNEVKVVFDSALGLYVMFLWDAFNSPNQLRRLTAATPDAATWTAGTNIRWPIPGSRTGWHGDIQIDSDGNYHCITSDSDTNRNFWAMSSGDGIAWNCSPFPLMTPSFSGWDNSALYRACWSLPIDGDGTVYDIWYAGVSSTGTTHEIAYAQWPVHVLP